MADNIMISMSRYESLCRSENILEALEQGGVDNWEWFEESLTEYAKVFASDQDISIDDAKEELYGY